MPVQHGSEDQEIEEGMNTPPNDSNVTHDIGKLLSDAGVSDSDAPNIAQELTSKGFTTVKRIALANASLLVEACPGINIGTALAIVEEASEAGKTVFPSPVKVIEDRDSGRDRR